MRRRVLRESKRSSAKQLHDSCEPNWIQVAFPSVQNNNALEQRALQKKVESWHCSRLELRQRWWATRSSLPPELTIAKVLLSALDPWASEVRTLHWRKKDRNFETSLTPEAWGPQHDATRLDSTLLQLWCPSERYTSWWRLRHPSIPRVEDICG